MPRGTWPGKKDAWTDAQIGLLKERYESVAGGGRVNIDALSLELGRLKSNVSRKARSLGLTKRGRLIGRKDRRKYKTREEWRAGISANRKKWIAEHGHPRGALGMHHTEASKMRISMRAKEHWASLTEAEKLAHTEKTVRARIANNTPPRQRHETTWKSGWREVGGQRFFARSRWEANAARYFEWLKLNGQILGWEHEPITFWFEAIRRGVRSYKPDFRITKKCGGIYYAEVKGWMDSRSKTTLRRMKKYHPSVTIDLIDSKRYKKLHAQCRRMIAGWEQ